MDGAQVLVPWQEVGCEHRAAALAFVGAHLSEHHGGFVLAELPTGEPWCKSRAIGTVMDDMALADPVSRMYAIPDDPVLVLHDADVVVAPEALTAAIDAVRSGRARWAVPHGTVKRLDQASTAAVLAGAPLTGRHKLDRPAYRGVEAGGIVVIERALYQEAPFDTRFQGFGHEDLSAAIAWRCLAGPPWRGNAPLYHLWHVPQGRISPSTGSRLSKLQHLEYQKASGDASRMRAVIAAGREARV